MKKYRLLINGRNFLIDTDGKPKKYGFYQNIFLEADSPLQAEKLALSKIWHDKELKEVSLNSKKDPPKITLDTFWELDVLEYLGHNIETGRTFYPEKKWWQFWK